MRQVDLFTENPMEFEGLWERSELLDLGGVSARVASIPDLIRRKERTGRPQDLEDIEAPRHIQEASSG